jgi:glutamyl/glutaminyl-tRNA synthetase
LAAVVKDHALGITHVLRSVERWEALPLYLRLCEMLGWTAPHFAHLPALRDDGPGTRPASLQACREQGYLPLAVANDLARMGWTPRGRRALLSMEALAARFDLSRVSRGPIQPAPGQLAWLNRRCIAGLEPEARTRLFAERWQRAYGVADRAAGTGLRHAAWRALLADAVMGEVDALAQVPALVRFAFAVEVEPDADAEDVLSRPYAGEVLAAFAEGLSTVEPYAYDQLDAMIHALRLRFKEMLGVRSRDVLHVARAALTGRVDGPCLVVACQLLGRARCLQRAQREAHTDPQRVIRRA